MVAALYGLNLALLLALVKHPQLVLEATALLLQLFAGLAELHNMHLTGLELLGEGEAVGSPCLELLLQLDHALIIAVLGEAFGCLAQLCDLSLQLVNIGLGCGVYDHRRTFLNHLLGFKRQSEHLGTAALPRFEIFAVLVLELLLLALVLRLSVREGLLEPPELVPARRVDPLHLADLFLMSNLAVRDLLVLLSEQKKCLAFDLFALV